MDECLMSCLEMEISDDRIEEFGQIWRTEIVGDLSFR
jgi:hypothetical protein